MKSCKCSNIGVRTEFKFCPYCGGQFIVPPKRYRYERMAYNDGSYAINTKQYRTPKKGEYYISGAVPMAYIAPNDLSQNFYIAEIIKPK